MILKIITMFVSLIFVPLLVGGLITKFIKKQENNLCLSFVIGHLIMLAVCQLISVPMIFARVRFSILLNTYVGTIIVLSIVSLIINIKHLKSIIIENFKILKELPKLLTIMVIVLVGIQIYGLVRYMHVDDDDAFYIATATTTVQTDSLFKYAAQDGREYGTELPIRYILGPFPMYYAIFSKIINIHPAIFAHTIMPIIFIPLTYIIYGLIGNELFDKNKKHVMMFMLFINLMYIWGNYSIRNNFTFLLFRVWQGKSILANIIIPAVWYSYIKARNDDFKFINYFLIFLVVFAGCFTTTMGIALPPLIVMILAISDEISKINFKDLKNVKYTEHLKNMLKIGSSCIPAAIYGILYLVV